MGLFDVDGFGSSSELTPIEAPKKEEKIFKANEFDSTLTDDIPPLVKMDVINSHYNLGKLLADMGIDMSGSTMYCPFHPDEATGHPSAKYHKDSDLLYCFSENKMYSAYHAIKFLYGINTDKVFKDIWGKLNQTQRKEYLEKHDATGTVAMAKAPTEWDKYKALVLDKFKNHEVNYRQYKNALFKVFQILSKSEPKQDE